MKMANFIWGFEVGQVPWKLNYALRTSFKLHIFKIVKMSGRVSKIMTVIFPSLLSTLYLCYQLC